MRVSKSLSIFITITIVFIYSILFAQGQHHQEQQDISIISFLPIIILALIFFYIWFSTRQRRLRDAKKLNTLQKKLEEAEQEIKRLKIQK